MECLARRSLEGKKFQQDANVFDVVQPDRPLPAASVRVEPRAGLRCSPQQMK
jgi:hypothetical protein